MQICIDTECGTETPGSQLSRAVYGLGDICNCSDLSSVFDPKKNTCGASCTSGYFPNIIQGICDICPSECKTCSSEASCQSCISGKFLLGSSCVDKCPDDRWSDGVNNICVECDPSCKACVGVGNTKCSECAPGYYKSKDSCVLLRSCPAKTFPNTATSSCEDCEASCKSCQYSKGQCTACEDTFFELGNPIISCVSSCPSGYRKSNKVCQPCQSNYCLSCDEATGLKCSNCVMGFFLHLETCVSKCPDNYFANPEEGLCVKCNDACLNCEGKEADQCLACKPGKFLNEMECVSACPDGFYSNTQLNTCEVCHSTCGKCKGAASTDCTDCPFPSILLEKDSQSSCVVSCPVGFFILENKCKACDSSCSGCFGEANTQCLTCQSGFFLSSEFKCLPKASIKCKDQETFLTAEEGCSTCTIGCKACEDEKRSSCLSCDANNFLYYIAQKTCVPENRCPDGTFKNMTSRVCASCSSECKTCSAEKYCLSCKDPLQTLRDGLCSSCKPNCMDCSDGKCTKCYPEYFWVSSNSTDIFDSCQQTCQESAKYVYKNTNGRLKYFPLIFQIEFNLI